MNKIAFGSLGLARWVLVGASAVSVLACRREEAEQSITPTIELDQAPAKIVKRDIDFGGKVKVLGYRVNGGGTLKAGRRVTVSVYWKAEQKLEPGYRLVAQLLDDHDRRLLTLDEAGPLREQKDGKPVNPPDSWQPGKVYLDELSFTVPKNVRTWRVKLVASLKKGDQLLPFSGGEVVNGYALVATSSTGVARARPVRPAELRVDRLDAKASIQLDGKLEEPAWQEARANKFVNLTNGRVDKRSPIQGSVRVLWNTQGLYFGVEVEDSDVVGGFKPGSKDPQLWTKDAIQILIDPQGNNKDYYEIQVNPQNLVYDTRYDDLRQPIKEPDGPFGHEDWSSQLKSAVVVKGTLDKSEDKDEGYVIEALIPWKALTKSNKTPPALGETWRINVYALQGVDTALAWSPILKKGDSHNAERFARVLFAEKGWEPTDPSAAAAAASAKPAVASAKDPASAPALTSAKAQAVKEDKAQDK